MIGCCGSSGDEIAHGDWSPSRRTLYYHTLTPSVCVYLYTVVNREIKDGPAQPQPPASPHTLRRKGGGGELQAVHV